MTTLTISASTPSLNTLTLPSLSTIAHTTALGTLDTAGRLVEAAENGVDSAAAVVRATVPAVARFIGGFLLPEHLNRVVGTVVDYGTSVGSTVAAAGAKATAQTITLGAPAWVGALREYVGVNAVSGALYHDENSREFLARCFAVHTSEPLIRDGLLSYLELRKELSTLQQSTKRDDDRFSIVSHDIAKLETKLRGYQDFTSLKMILENSNDFVREQYKRINQLATEAAGCIVGGVENYYKDQCGHYAGELEGSWSSAASENERSQLRTELTQKIAGRLQTIFESDLTNDETRANLDALAGDLHSAFGTYRDAFKASLYTLFGLGYASGAVHYLADSAGVALREYATSTLDWLGAELSSTANSITEYITSSAQDLGSSWYTAARDYAAEAMRSEPLGKAAESVAQTYQEGVGLVSDGVSAAAELTDSAITAASDGAESAGDAVNQLLPERTPNYASPHWTGTDRLFMGLGPDGAPAYGHSCTSGFPAEARISTPSPGLDTFRELATPQSRLTEMLKAHVGTRAGN